MTGLSVVTNVWDFLSDVAQWGIPAVVTLLTYRWTRKGQDPKLDEIHTAVNGNLDAEKKKNARLEKKIRELGGEP